MEFNPPPGWPTPPPGWTPPENWTPDPSWPATPPGWSFWTDTEPPATPAQRRLAEPLAAEQEQPVPAVPTPAAASTVSTPQNTADNAAPGRHTAEGLPVASDVPLLTARIAELELELAHARAGAGDVIELSDQRVLQDVGIYRYHHPLETSVAYKDRLTTIEDQVRDMVKAGQAILAADMFTYDGSLAKGRRMVADLSKLMLRAYNAEADNCVRSLRSGNAATATRRLASAVTAIERLGAIMQMRVNPWQDPVN